jgi:hypothetical protein
MTRAMSGAFVFRMTDASSRQLRAYRLKKASNAESVDRITADEPGLLERRDMRADGLSGLHHAAAFER